MHDVNDEITRRPWCRGSGTSMGGVQGGMRRHRKVRCPVCGRMIGMRPSRAGRLYPHYPPREPDDGPMPGHQPNGYVVHPPEELIS